MNNIEQKALELLQECGFHGGYIDRKWNEQYEALCRAIEQQEAFRQEVSDAVVFAVKVYGGHSGMFDPLRRFIITKPDPLVIEAREICARVCEGWIDIPKDRAAAYRAGSHDDEADFAYVYAALAKRGLEIREKE